MKLAGIELHNFRSIGEEPVVLNPWRKCNILIGQNNAGKSNIIKAIRRISDSFSAATTRVPSQVVQHLLQDLDLHGRCSENRFRFRLCFECDTPEDDELAKLARSASFHFDFSWQMNNIFPTVIDHSLAHIEDFRQANELLEYSTGSHWSRIVNPDAIRREFLEKGQTIWGRFFRGAIPRVYVIPEFRQIRPTKSKEEGEYTLDGGNLVGLLAQYQHPGVGKDDDRMKFERLQEFIRELLHLPEAVLEVSHDGTTIILKNSSLRLPLASYGTAVHELVILMTAVLSMDNVVCCIEEPEIHFHPRLQREFIQFIATETTNHYLISTHSPTFINAMNLCEDMQVFHLWLKNGATVGTPILNDEDSLLALQDLGVRASDILQSNSIIWVEGPSDRIYLKRWLDLVAPELVEGKHYSIMFYGGRLLSHLCIDRDKVPDQLICILKINQNAVVVMDSDREKPGDRLSGTKLRVREECERSGSLCWITDGREVENYLPENAIVDTCNDVLGKQIRISIGQYDRFEDALSRALRTIGDKDLDYPAAKVKYARMFAQYFELDEMDGQLRKHIENIADRIKTWNE